MDFRNNLTKKLKGYVPGEQPTEEGWIKLNTNENPWPPSPRVLEFISELSQRPELLRKYPSPLGEPLRSAIASFYGLKPQEVLITNGSDEALSLIFRAFTERGDLVLVPEITYSLYPVLCEVSGATLQKVPMKDDLKIDLESLCRENAKMVVLANPNAPTGEFLAVDIVEKAIANNPNKLWVIDEAYNDFVEIYPHSLAEKVQNYPNLLVCRTFSKSHSLAGLRVGYVLGKNELLLDALYALKDSYNEDALALHIALQSFLDTNYSQKCWQFVIQERKKLAQALTQLGFRVLPSEANFLFATHKQSAEELYLKLKEKKILVRHFSYDKIANFLRITIGKEKENLLLLEALSDILNR